MESGEKNFYQDNRNFKEFLDSTRIIRGRIHGISESLIMLERLLLEQSFEQGLDLVRIMTADLGVLETFFEEGITRSRGSKADKAGVHA